MYLTDGLVDMKQGGIQDKIYKNTSMGILFFHYFLVEAYPPIKLLIQYPIQMCPEWNFSKVKWKLFKKIQKCTV